MTPKLRRQYDDEPDASEARLLAATVGPGHYRVLTRRPLTVALGPGAHAPALACGALGFAIGLRYGLIGALVAGGITALAMELSVAAHEAGHLLFGRHVRGITPRILLLRRSGGAAIVEGRFSDARGAALFAAGGPLVSAALTVAYAAAASFMPSAAVRTGFLLPAAATAFLLLLNLLPVAPTDGYALFRSALWAEIGSRAEAERRAIAWSRAVLAFGLAVTLELFRWQDAAAFAALAAVTALTVQHHLVFRRLAAEARQEPA